MNLFSSFAAFVAVAAIAYPLYEGPMAIAVAGVAGVLVAVFVAVAQQKHQQQQSQFKQEMNDSAKAIVEHLASYQQQLTNQVSELSDATNKQLMGVWTTTQSILTADAKEIQQASVSVMVELAKLQQQQEKLANESAQNLQQWLQQQNMTATETLLAVRTSQEELLQNTKASHDKVETLWTTHHEQQLAIREGEQQKFTSMLAAVEAKEAAYSEHLNEQRDIFTKAQQQLQHVLSEHAQQSHDALLVAWKETASEQLQLRKEEHAHILTTQQTVTNLIETNTAALQDNILEGWHATRESLQTLRQQEQEQATQLFEMIEQTNNEMAATLVDQRQTFDIAQGFYANTYEQIKHYTADLAQHEAALISHHQLLIDTQQTIKDSITNILQQVMNEHTDVLATTQQTLVEGISELKDQRATSQDEFEEFLVDFLESVDKQEKLSKEFTTNLQREMTNLIEDNTDQLRDVIRELKKTTTIHSKTIGDILADSKNVIEQNQTVLNALHEQTEETKKTARTLGLAMKEISALNTKDMDILQRLMR